MFGYAILVDTEKLVKQHLSYIMFAPACYILFDLLQLILAALSIFVPAINLPFITIFCRDLLRVFN